MSELMLAQNMCELRKLKEYTQQYVSDQLHIARQTYSLYENGKRTPDIETVCSLAKLYHISADALLHTDLTGGRIADSPPSRHTGIVPGESSILLSGTEAKLIMDYKSLSPELQEEARRHMRYLKALAETEN